MKQVYLFILGIFLSLGLVGQNYPVLDLSPNPDTIHLNHRRQVFYLRYNIVKSQDKMSVINQLNASLEGLGRWIAVTNLEESGSAGRLTVEVLENSTASSRWAVFHSLVDGQSYFVCQHAAGMLPAFYTVGGTTYLYPGRNAAVTLSGSEVGVNYTLWRGTVNVGTLPGTGSALSFPVNQTGTYTVKASRDGVSVDMKGSPVIKWYPVLQGKITVNEPLGQGLPVDGGSVSFPYVLAENYPAGDVELEEIMESCMNGESSA